MKKIAKLFFLLLIALSFTACDANPAEVESPIVSSVDYNDLPQIQFEARYIFEQMILPQSVFTYESEMAAMIQAANVEAIQTHILLLWEFAAANVIWRELVEQYEQELPTNEEEIIARANELRPIRGLGDEHIVDVTAEQIDADTNAFIIQLFDTNTALLSTHIGIAYNETMGLWIFTLEGVQDASGRGVGAHAFCFIGVASRGSFHIIENDRQVFLEGIGDVMSGLADPAVGFGLPRP